MTEWFGISLPYATYAVVVRDGVVVDAAPIARWMVGKQWADCAAWATRKGAKVRALR